MVGGWWVEGGGWWVVGVVGVGVVRLYLCGLECVECGLRL